MGCGGAKVLAAFVKSDVLVAVGDVCSPGWL